MTLLASADELRERRLVVRGTLRELGHGLRAELQPLIEHRPEIPHAKALLSRDGGRCPCDGGYLPYDPFSTRHRCDRCGREHDGEHHDRFRLYWHQLWLAERTLHASLLGVLLDDAACVALATAMLDEYADRYLRYPNRDNVLGPSRPFFSTYLESIWLLQLAIALDLLETGAPASLSPALAGRVRDRLVAPSAALIASFDEGASNRQVWNNAALFAAARLLGDERLAERAVGGPSGLHAHLAEALLADGSWYEGENYHLFAHRGLWYGVTMAERAGVAMPGHLAARFRDGFAAPFRTLLPDLTFPSRRDSPYAVSARQLRIAESCELGIARDEDERLLAMLARLYDPSVPRGDAGRARSSADVEQRVAATGLARRDLSWRSLLFARETLPELVPAPMQSDLLEEQGIGIIRRDDGRLYVALDYGRPGGGHGHPDRLQLLLSRGAERLFDDPGTGSYVDDSLHWYRSTLAHHAPLVDGRSQPTATGTLLTFQDDGALGMLSAEAELAPGMMVRRTVVVCDDYLVDELSWAGDAPHEITLPVHGVVPVDAEQRPLPVTRFALVGGSAREDGYSYLTDVARVRRAVESGPVRLARPGVHGWMVSAPLAELWTASAPGVPGATTRAPNTLARAHGAAGRIVTVWSWTNAVDRVETDGGRTVVIRRDGGIDEHRAAAPPAVPPRTTRPSAERSPRVIAMPARARLGADHYRRSEESWAEAGEPTASVEIARNLDRVIIDVTVEPSGRRFVPIDAPNPYDNEPFAINGDGVQLYAAFEEKTGGWLIVPHGDQGDVGVRPIEGWAGLEPPSGTWSETPRGYGLLISLPIPAGAHELLLDLIVNDAGRGRVRRRGQLVLSGAAGEFVYLRGDRHEPARLLRYSLPDV